MPGAHNGVGDAFRHTVWMALNTQSFGRQKALELGLAHENSSLGPDSERRMDLNSNSWGANYAASHPDFTMEQFVRDFNVAMDKGDVVVLDRIIGQNATFYSYTEYYENSDFAREEPDMPITTEPFSDYSTTSGEEYITTY